MADIRPFRGIRYNTRRFAGESMAALVAPPYDVINDAEQAALYARHPQNIVRLDLNRIRPEDSAENNRYTRSRRHLMDWLATGVLAIEHAPAIYAHEQDFRDDLGKLHTRRGFVSLVRLAEYEEGVVLPHERTLKGPKIDRLDLMKATECNLSQVFFLYEDPQLAVDALLSQAIQGHEPVSITTTDGITHRLWAVHDPEVHTQLAALLEQRALLIADGHHRYETALAYREFRRSVREEGHPLDADAPYEFTMGFLVNLHDPGLQVFPTHRVVFGLEDFDPQHLLKTLQASLLFEVETLPEPMARDHVALQAALATAGASHPSFVLLSPSVAQPWLVRFTGGTGAAFFDPETPEQVRALDVAILHEGIIDGMLGISKAAQEAKTNLDYIKGMEPAMAAASQPGHQLVVLMNPTPVAQVDSVCRSGGKMPQKSTFFYPKILSGLVINPV